MLPPEVEWSGELPSSLKHSQGTPPLLIPMPTLYNDVGVESSRSRPKPSIIELVLYNMAAMLASFAAGYDVRLSNVSPFHPRLLLDRGEEDAAERQWWYNIADDRSDHAFSSPSGYSHNTYHGPARHYRPLLNNFVHQSGPVLCTLETDEGGIRPLHSQLSALKLSHSGSHAGSRTGSRTSSRQSSRAGSPRRMNSSNSEPSEVMQHALMSPPYPQNQSSAYDTSQYSPRPEMYRTELSLVHSPSRQCCIEYGGSPPHYKAEHEAQLFPDFGGTSMDVYHQQYHAYDNPGSSIGSSGSMSTLSNMVSTPSLPRTPSRLMSSFGHRKNPSSVSNSSNINLSFGLEDEDSGHPTHSTPTHRPEWTYEYSPGLQYYPRQNSRDLSDRDTAMLHRSTPPDSLTSEDSSYVSAKEGSYSSSFVSRVRFSPVTALMSGLTGPGGEAAILEMAYHDHPEDKEDPLRGRHAASKVVEKELLFDFGSTRLRSSLKRANYSPVIGRSGTPTNPTPPESLASEDSSYMSGKDGANSVSRVHFSPLSSPKINKVGGTGIDINILDMPIHGETQDCTIPLQAVSRRYGRHSRDSSRSRRPSLSDLEREFLT